MSAPGRDRHPGHLHRVVRLHPAGRPVHRRDPDRQRLGLPATRRGPGSRSPAGSASGWRADPPYSSVRRLVSGEMNEASRYPCARCSSSRSNPAASAMPGGADEVGGHLVHVGPGHLPRHLVVRPVRDGRRRDQRPVPFGQRLVLAFPQHAGRALPPGVRELDADLGLALPVHEVHDPLPPGRRAPGDTSRRSRGRSGPRGSRRSSRSSPARRRRSRGCRGAPGASRSAARPPPGTGTSTRPRSGWAAPARGAGRA